THYQTAGISEAQDTTSGQTFDKDGFTRNAFLADFDKQIARGLHLKPYFRYTHFTGDYDGGAFTDADSKYEAQLLTAGTQLQYSFANGSIHAYYNYDEVNRNFKDTYGEYPYVGSKNSVEL